MARKGGAYTVANKGDEPVLTEQTKTRSDGQKLDEKKAIKKSVVKKAARTRTGGRK